MENQRTGPSMFHRRLILIAAVMSAVMLLLGAQLVRLSVVEGAENLAKAEVTLHRSTLLPTYRGSIVDRRGRKLAVDRPGYAIAVDYDVITGDWERRQARRQARKALGARWGTLSPEAREAATRRVLPEWTEKTDRLWDAIRRLGGIDEEVLEATIAKVREDVEDLAGRVGEQQRLREIEQFGYDEADYEFKPGPIREQEQAHVVLPSVSDETAFAMRAMAGELPDRFEVQHARRRVYPWMAARVPIDRSSLPRPLASSRPLTVRVSGVADHMLGSMREVHAVDVERRPYRDPRTGDADLGGYLRVADVTGASGLERSMEDHLRGLRGRVRRRLDSADEQRVDPVPGIDVELTIDISLQARIQAIMSDEVGLATVQSFHKNENLPVGWPLNGAAVVLEVETGEILAMVSMPTRAMGRQMAEIDAGRFEMDQSWCNRPAEAVYPPGSIIKPLVLCTAIGEGVHRLREPIHCGGFYFPERERPRCWLYREVYGFATHSDLVVEDAIAQSCNIYFYTLADRIGMHALTDWYRRFGLGTYPRVGLLHREVHEGGDEVAVGESAGYLPSRESIDAMNANDRRNALIIMGIGQGPVTWTPLQAAGAFAKIARGGRHVRSTILAGDDRDSLDRGGPGAAGEDIEIAPATVAAVLEGLRRSVMERKGTGHHITYAPGDEEPIFNAEGVTVWAKTGTAQAPPLRLGDTNGDGEIDEKDERIAGVDHAWCVGLAGPDATGRPEYAFAVLVEYGGSGGRVAGPIANQVIRALQDEGYLARTAEPEEGALSAARGDG